MFSLRNLFAAVRLTNNLNKLTNSMRALNINQRIYSQQQGLILDKADYYKTKATSKQDDSNNECQEIVGKINQQLQRNEEGRLFAVVHLCGKQFKITAGDIILVEGYWPPTVGDQIRLEKVLLAGARDFTLIGRPLLETNLVDVKATIIEKTLSHTKTHFKKKRRKQYMRINFQRSPYTMLRINSIDIKRNIQDTQPASNTVE